MNQDNGAYSLIGYQLKRAQAALRSRMDDELRPLGLTTPQYSCLEALSHSPGASNSDLARAVFVTRQTMSALLHSLEARGLVQRADRAPGGRAIPTSLTSEGQALLTEAARVSERIEQRMVANLTESQMEALRSGLAACVEALVE
jgi:DNA-binding MarR family transcriptional regulator